MAVMHPSLKCNYCGKMIHWISDKLSGREEHLERVHLVPQARNGRYEDHFCKDMEKDIKEKLKQIPQDVKDAFEKIGKM
jgi:hypothetical protein